MQRLLEDIDIYQINYSSKGENYKYFVGQKIRIDDESLKISRIERDETTWQYYGKVAYLVIVERNGKDYIWRVIEDKPVELILNIRNDKNRIRIEADSLDHNH